MAVYLVQHGYSLSKEADPEKGLSELGFSEVQMIADMVRDRNVPVSQIIHSGKKRAEQTAHIFAEELVPKEGLARMDGLNPMDDVKALAEKMDANKNAMLIGHLPFMEKLVSYLITGSVDKPVVKFQNAGVVCLDQEPERGDWFIKWTLLPVIA